jgi:hypothetical protein
MPEPTSPGVAQERKIEKDFTAYLPDNDQKEAQAFYLRRFEKARQQRHQKRRDFDDMSLEEDYVANQLAANAYLTPKKNDDEVRIVTGSIEKKVETVYNELVAMNIQPDAQVFDHEDNELRNLGRDMMDVVKRTNQIERDDKFWKAFILEMITQRAVFGEECDEYQTFYNRGRSLISDNGLIKKEDRKPIVFHRAKKRMRTNQEIFLGDMNIPARDFQDQPYIIKYVRRHYDVSKSFYGGWENFKYVKPGGSCNKGAYGYRMYKLESDEVEEIHYLDAFKDEYQIMINGVMMFDEPAPLFYEVTEDRRYPMFMAILKDMNNNCAYGKPLVVSARTLHAIDSEMIRMMIEKFRQSIKPPMGSKGRKIYSKDIWTAGAVTYGIKEDDFFQLNKNQGGVTSAEFAMYDLIQRKVEEFIGARNLGSQSGEQTATEIVDAQRQFMKQLGLSVLALVMAKQDATYLRIYNLLENFINPKERQYDKATDKVIDIFEKFTTLNGQFENGKVGKKIIQFTDKELTREDKEEIYRYEQSEEEAGRPIRLRFINTKLLSSIPTFWYVTAEPREREGTALSKVLFNDKMDQAVKVQQVSGRPINGDKLVDEYEFTWQVKDMFKKSAPANQPANEESADIGQRMLEQIGAFEQSAMGDQMKEGAMAGQTNRPSLNTINNA